MVSVGRHAVVVGGSMGGLAGARVLSSRFDRVTVLDRDVFPAQPCDRRGVPHGPHAHALTIGGLQALEGLFPGLTAELIAGGAVPFDPGMDLLFVQMGAPRIRFVRGVAGLSQSRAFLEWMVRRRVQALPNVEFREQTAVSGLAGGANRVAGVELAGGEVLEADLVLGAAGHDGALNSRWLDRLGCASPSHSTVKVDIGYASRLYRRRPGDLPDGGVITLMAGTPPHEKRAAGAFPIEGDRWMVTLGGWHRDHPPADPAGFADFAAGLPAPFIADLIARSEPLADVVTRKFPVAHRRYFERLRQPPTGYAVLGDMICSFNPVYGQGMTVAVLEAIALGAALDAHRDTSAGMVRAYYRAAGKLADTPWQTATGSDFMYPETTGPRPRGTGLINWYAQRAILASHVSADVHRVLLDIQHMLIPPSALLRPATVARSLRLAHRSPALAAGGRHHDLAAPEHMIAAS
jgi:2-polyprenyl-6-methoxyphenol hydroxylase-like FAD-dependent oxidoreductase